MAGGAASESGIALGVAEPAALRVAGRVRLFHAGEVSSVRATGWSLAVRPRQFAFGRAAAGRRPRRQGVTTWPHGGVLPRTTSRGSRRGEVAWLASVASPDLRERVLRALDGRASGGWWWPAPRPRCAGVAFAYARPERFGVDRFLALLGAREPGVPGAGGRRRHRADDRAADLLDGEGRYTAAAASPPRRRRCARRCTSAPRSCRPRAAITASSPTAWRLRRARLRRRRAVALVERLLNLREARDLLGREPPRLLVHGGGAGPLLLPAAAGRARTPAPGAGRARVRGRARTRRRGLEFPHDRARPHRRPGGAQPRCQACGGLHRPGATDAVAAASPGVARLQQPGRPLRHRARGCAGRRRTLPRPRHAHRAGMAASWTPPWLKRRPGPSCRIAATAAPTPTTRGWAADPGSARLERSALRELPVPAAPRQLPRVPCPPPPTMRPSRQATLRKLTAGIGDYYVIQRRRERQRRRAGPVPQARRRRARLAELQRAGISARIETQGAPASQWWRRMPAPSSAMPRPPRRPAARRWTARGWLGSNAFRGRDRHRPTSR